MPEGFGTRQPRSHLLIPKGPVEHVLTLGSSEAGVVVVLATWEHLAHAFVRSKGSSNVCFLLSRKQ